MNKVRLALTKDAEICFVSHLEYMKTIERAVKRAKLPVAYSEGFNPHMKFSLASALSVGVSSSYELCEMDFTEQVEAEVVVQKLTASLPRGIRIVQAELVLEKTDKLMAMVQAAEYEVSISLLAGASVDTAKCLQGYEQLPRLEFEKKMPRGRGSKQVDIKEFVLDLRMQVVDSSLQLGFSCRITPSGSLKAMEIVTVLTESLQLPVDLDSVEIVRTCLYTFDKGGQRKSLLRA